MKTALLILVVTVAGCISAAAPNQRFDADKAAIRKAALDYLEGWYEGTPSEWRVRSSGTAKRIKRPVPGASSVWTKWAQ